MIGKPEYVGSQGGKIHSNKRTRPSAYLRFSRIKTHIDDTRLRSYNYRKNAKNPIMNDNSMNIMIDDAI